MRKSASGIVNRLHATYNGFMLGQFLYAATQRETDLEIVTRRCSEFFTEIDFDIDLPTTHDGYRKLLARKELGEVLFDHSWELGAAFLIGLTTTDYFCGSALGDAKETLPLDVLADVTKSPGLDDTVREPSTRSFPKARAADDRAHAHGFGGGVCVVSVQTLLFPRSLLSVLRS